MEITGKVLGQYQECSLEVLESTEKVLSVYWENNRILQIKYWDGNLKVTEKSIERTGKVPERYMENTKKVLRKCWESQPVNYHRINPLAVWEAPSGVLGIAEPHFRRSHICFGSSLNCSNSGSSKIGHSSASTIPRNPVGATSVFL